MVSPFDLIGGILNSELKRESSCAKDTSLGEFLRDKMLQRSLSTDIVQATCRPVNTVKAAAFLKDRQAGLLKARLRIRSIFGRIRILPIRLLKSDPDPGSYWHLKNQFKHLNFFHIKHISSDI